jgi:hypothetical protein
MPAIKQLAEATLRLLNTRLPLKTASQCRPHLAFAAKSITCNASGPGLQDLGNSSMWILYT